MDNFCLSVSDEARSIPAICTAKATVTKYSLFVKAENWSVGFKTSPFECIVVEGRRPTKEEFRDALAYSQLPIFAIDALYISSMMGFNQLGGANGN
ncbi:hypothetical protein [Aeromonas veronii]|uniref:hypothetical protein n=1 Tax=Aeromonas veronii TaxID=654 RepID=UPI0024865956|nr:hypothetical protein [Aeromonas veronii]